MDKEAQELRAIEASIGYRFKQKTLLVQSLTHPSYFHNSRREGEHNQRLEFLGDAILSAILAEALYLLFPNEREGALSCQRSMLARGDFLCALARRLGLNKHLRMSRVELRNNGNERKSTLEDSLEALVGAIYLDSDFNTARHITLTWFGDLREALSRHEGEHNPKGQLQELVQPTLGNEAVEYYLVEESGPDHNKTFLINVTINREIKGTGTGSSKKEAEENAARAALAKGLDI